MKCKRGCCNTNMPENVTLADQAEDILTWYCVMCCLGEAEENRLKCCKGDECGSSFEKGFKGPFDAFTYDIKELKAMASYGGKKAQLALLKIYAKGKNV